MSGILIFAFLSFILMYKLFKSFGRVQQISIEQFGNILHKRLIDIGAETISPNILRLQEVLPEYKLKDLRQDLEMMFVAIFKAFAASKHEDLKVMLSDKMYESFSEQINKRETMNLRQEIDIKTVSSEIEEVKILNERVFVNVLFRSSQMSATVNADGVSFDNPSKLYIDVIHKWVFERNLSLGSVWILNKTSVVR